MPRCATPSWLLVGFACSCLLEMIGAVFVDRCSLRTAFTAVMLQMLTSTLTWSWLLVGFASSCLLEMTGAVFVDRCSLHTAFRTVSLQLQLIWLDMMPCFYEFRAVSMKRSIASITKLPHERSALRNICLWECSHNHTLLPNHRWLLIN